MKPTAQNHPSIPAPKTAVIFDLDGTLLDTLADLANAMNAALAQLGFPPHTPDECRHYVGDGASRFAERALPPDARHPDTIRRLTAAYVTQYAAHWNRETKPYPGIPELLSTLTTRAIPLAVLSNKPHDFVCKTVPHFFPNIPFALLRGARPETPLKPDPADALRTAALLACPPERIFFIGDTRTDMLTARAAGMIPIGALWGFRSADELLATGAQHLIEHPADFLPLLKPDL